MRLENSTRASYQIYRPNLKQRSGVLRGKTVGSCKVSAPKDEVRLKELRGEEQWPRTQWRIRTQNLKPTYKGK